MKNLATEYAVPPVLREGTKLPTSVARATVTLSAENGITVRADGTVALVDSSREASGTITAVIHADSTSPENDITKQFSVSVLPRSESTDLLSYHRPPTTAALANNEDIAHSMHLAVLDETKGQDWSPLNENYGVFFARSSKLPVDGEDASKIPHRSLKDPSLFYTREGNFGVAAVRVPRVETNIVLEENNSYADGLGAQQTSEDAHCILIATSADLLSYCEAPDSQSLLKLPESNGVCTPHIAFDTAENHYVISWQDNSGVSKYITLKDLIVDSVAVDARDHVPTIGLPIRINAVLDCAIDQFTHGHSIPVRKEILDGLIVRLGRIVNTGYQEFPPIHVTAGTSVEELALPTSATLHYSDTSSAHLPIELWDSSAIDLSQPGEYELTATIKQTQYPIPFAEDRADPSVLRWDWVTAQGTATKFLMIATNDIHGDCVWQAGAPHMPLRMADSIAELADTPFDSTGLVDQTGRNPKEHIIMKLGDVNTAGDPISGSFWAPELHTINGRLTVLFMPCFNNEWTDGAAHFAQLKKDDQGFDLDPTLSTSWSTPQEVTRADGTKLAINTDGGIGMSLDMTYFVDEMGQSYYSWQQLGAVYLAKMDPTDPSKTTSDPVLIVSPEYAWDNVISEGPNVLVRDGKFYMIYSGSSVGTSYTTGLAIADASGNTDLLTPDAWHRLNYPIQKSGIFNGEWQLGTGHGMWSKDEDGKDLYVFHAYANETPGYSNVAGRDTFLCRVHWAADNLPIFDMDRDEEVSPHTTIVQTVVVS